MCACGFPFLFFYHNRSSLRGSQQRELYESEVDLMDVKGQRDSETEENKKGGKVETDCVSSALSRMEHVVVE